jgi:hypothetical protein
MNISFYLFFLSFHYGFCHSYLNFHLLGAFSKLRKDWAYHVRLSVRTKQLDSHWKDFDEIWYLGFFLQPVSKNQVLLKSDKNNGFFTWRRFTFMNISRLILLRTRNVTDKWAEWIKIHILYSITCSRNSCCLWDNVDKYCRARGHKWRHNMTHARLMLVKQGYTDAYMRKPKFPGTHTLARMNVRVHKHTKKYIILFIAFHGKKKMIRERASVLRYT